MRHSYESGGEKCSAVKVGMTFPLARHPFSTAEYHRMIETGIFTEDDRLELIDGEIVQMAAIGPRHAACVDRLAEPLRTKIRSLAILRVQSPVQLSEHSEPQPDLSLLKRRADFYAQNHPTPECVLLAIEVADITAEGDRQVKIPAYGRAGISEAWLVDLAEDRIEINTQPNNGIYQEIRRVLRGQHVASKALPQLKLKADDILG